MVRGRLNGAASWSNVAQGKAAGENRHEPLLPEGRPLSRHTHGIRWWINAVLLSIPRSDEYLRHLFDVRW